MNRRTFLATSAAVVGSLAGCAGGESTTESTPRQTPSPRPTGTPPYYEGVDLPDGVYVQPFENAMSMQGRAEVGPYRVALMYAAPHRFWLVEGDRASERPIRPADDLHLMAVVWDGETGVVVPETGLSVEIARNGDTVSEEVIYPMLSQSMGFHYGGNFILDGDGTYEVDVTVGGLPIRATGAFEGRFESPQSATISLSFTEAEREAVSVERLEAYGGRGAASPSRMDALPSPLTIEEVRGEALGTASTHDAEVVPTVLDGADAPVGERYLAVYLRTPYNRMAILGAAWSATVRRSGEVLTEMDLRRTFDPEVGYHYGAELSTTLRAGDEVVLTPVTPPQVARH
ncbi:MAG: iron transporter, partial [Natronomonas sp.]